MSAAEIKHDSEAWRDLVDLDRLRGWMDAEGLGSGPIEDAAPLGGGTQNILLGFARAGRRYVLRRPPRHLRKESNETMRREARVLAALAGSDVPHPPLIAGCPDETVIGAAFYLMEPVEGFNATLGLPSPHADDPAWRRGMGEAIVDGAVALAKVDPDAVGLTGLGKLDGWLERQVPRWRAQLDSYSQFEGWGGYAELPDVDRICAWLDANRPAQMRPGLIHGDYHLANVMYRHDSPKLAAIVDWELATLGDPLLDLGWLCSMWPQPEVETVERTPVTPWDGFPTLDEAVDRYLAATGRARSEVKWFAVLACFKLGAILEGSHARACAGKTPKAVGDQLHANTVRLFTRALRRIDAPGDAL